MKHLKHICKLGRTGSHKRCMLANMLKALIMKGRIETTLAKAKELRRYADKMVTLAKKKDVLAAKRLASARMMIRHNALTSKERRRMKNHQDLSVYNDDRQVINKLFNDITPRYQQRNGGYTRIIKKSVRIGDNAPMCIIEYIE